MSRTITLSALTIAALACASCATSDEPRDTSGNPMTFFLTSAGPGKGADLGGLAGADRHCQSLAQSAGAGRRTWRAYLSTTGVERLPAANARDRIGRGPWRNAKGEVIAKDVNDLHGSNNLTKQTALTEKGGVVSGRGDPVNMHDVLTGSTPDGRAMPAGKDTTCADWTSGGEGSAIAGHHDRQGLSDTEAARSWNSSHPTKGCSQEALRSTGGAGLFYCFAAN